MFQAQMLWLGEQAIPQANSRVVVQVFTYSLYPLVWLRHTYNSRSIRESVSEKTLKKFIEVSSMNELWSNHGPLPFRILAMTSYAG